MKWIGAKRRAVYSKEMVKWQRCTYTTVPYWLTDRPSALLSTDWISVASLFDGWVQTLVQTLSFRYRDANGTKWETAEQGNPLQQQGNSLQHVGSGMTYSPNSWVLIITAYLAYVKRGPTAPCLRSSLLCALWVFGKRDGPRSTHSSRRSAAATWTGSLCIITVQHPLTSTSPSLLPVC